MHKRITALEENFESFRNEIDGTLKRVNASIDSVRRLAKKEFDKQRSQVKAIDTKMEEFAVGGIDLELVGLTWLLVGVVSSSLASELARILGS